MSPTDVIFSKSKKGTTEKLMKRLETQTCSVTYHNKAMDQISVGYVKGFGGGGGGGGGLKKPQVTLL